MSRFPSACWLFLFLAVAASGRLIAADQTRPPVGPIPGTNLPKAPQQSPTTEGYVPRPPSTSHSSPSFVIPEQPETVLVPSNVVRVTTDNPEQERAQRNLGQDITDRFTEFAQHQQELEERMSEMNSRILLLYLYAAAATAGSIWLMRSALSTKKKKKSKQDEATELFPEGAGTAHITIRDSSTQETGLHSVVATKRMVKRSETQRESRRISTSSGELPGAPKVMSGEEIIASERAAAEFMEQLAMETEPSKAGDKDKDRKDKDAGKPRNLGTAIITVRDGSTQAVVSSNVVATNRRTSDRLKAVTGKADDSEKSTVAKQDAAEKSGTAAVDKRNVADSTGTSPIINNITRIFGNNKKVDLSAVPQDGADESALTAKDGKQQPPAVIQPEKEPDTKSFSPQEPIAPEILPPTSIHKKGFSLLEVMISLAVLATVSSALISGLYTLDMSKRASKEASQVQELAHSLAERVLGAQWDWLGKDRPDDASGAQLRGAWSWHRRANPRQPGVLPLNPPMTQEAAEPENNLITQKLLGQKTGIDGLKVYLEYYRMSALEQQLVASDPYATWKAIAVPTDLSAEPFIYPESPAEFDLAQTSDALVVRIYVLWNSVLGGTRQHEVILSRRK
jgi:prepilin-type N-terminal cleavage/methylation domain-containing protein